MAARANRTGNLQTTLLQAAQQAHAFYSAHEWDKAQAVCQMILSAQANHFDALNLSGIIAAQTQRSAEALEFFKRAVAVKKDEPTAHNNYGNVLRDLGRYDEALRAYNRAVQLRPNYAEGHYNRGLTLYGLKRFADALGSYDRAIKLNPNYASAYNNRGAVLRELKQLDDAVISYDKAIALIPEHATAYNNRGVVLQELKRTTEALASYDKALAINPLYAEALNNQGNALRELQRFDEALESFDAALKIDADYAEAHYGRADTLRALKLHDIALPSYERAMALKPDMAADPFERGGILLELGRFEEALSCYQQAFERNPEQPLLRGIVLHAQLRICDWNGLEARLADLAASIEQGKAATPPFVVVTATDSPALQRAAAQIWVRDTCPPKADLPPLPKYARREKIRIGYYSADYYNHATAILAAGLFENHDKSRFEIVAYNYGLGQRDRMTERLEAAFDRFVDVRGRSDIQIAELSREHGIDIAVDLKGFTLHQRAGIFAQRAAPVQVAYLGYPGTMAAPCIDYLVADRTLIPRESLGHYTEKIVYLPGSYQVNDRSRPIAEWQPSRADVGLPAAGFVFCSFNNVYKLMPEMFGCWMRILQRVSGSVLWLLEENPTAGNNLRKAAQAAGVDPARLIFSPRLPGPSHLARHRLAGLFLDTFPCNAHTTASDALWAGLPVLTLAGESFPARVAASLLNAVGLPELVTTSLAQYESLAVELAENPQRSAALRHTLEIQRLTSSLFDTPAFTRHLENGYLQMYDRYQAGAAPDHIYVEAGLRSPED
jgi:protein O-GlcNAc transferase